jgi:hypothetical protein
MQSGKDNMLTNRYLMLARRREDSCDRVQRGFSRRRRGAIAFAAFAFAFASAYDSDCADITSRAAHGRALLDASPVRLGGLNVDDDDGVGGGGGGGVGKKRRKGDENKKGRRTKVGRVVCSMPG